MSIAITGKENVQREFIEMIAQNKVILTSAARFSELDAVSPHAAERINNDVALAAFGCETRYLFGCD